MSDRSPGPHRDDTPPTRGLTLLVADDDERVRRQVAQWLAPVCETIAASDGEEALRLARELSPDGALLDVAMPGVSGIAAAWVLRNDPRFERIPVVFMTAASEPPADPASPDDHDIWLEGLGDAYVQKPLTRDTIVALVSSIVPRHPAAGGARPAADLGPEWDRRLYPRLPVSIRGRVLAPDAERDGLVLSLSPRGAFIKSDISLDPGTSVALSFPSHAGEFLGSCDVLYRSDDDSCRGIGVQFRELTPRSEALLLRAMRV